MRQILDKLKLDNIEYTCSADIKMLRILTGKAGGNPSYGCP